MIDVAPYLQRIGYEGPAGPSIDTLRAVHRAHLLTVPFENLDIHLGTPIVLSVERFYEKIVHGRRGGFCYELNGLFAVLLGALGFRVGLLSARVVTAGGHVSPPFDHLTLDVQCPGSPERWLADVGFGDGFLEPLPLASGAERQQENGFYRIDADSGEFVLRRRADADGTLADQYRFSTEPHALAEFEGMCRYQQTSPQSHFTQQRICSLATPEGRVTLTGSRLIETRPGQRSERPIGDAATHRALLLERFGVRVTGDWVR